MKILIRNQKHEDWQLVQSAAYGAEAELQRLLAEAPSLVSVNEVREGAGTLVVAVSEFPLDVGYIDLVGFTAEGDIAVIECKLASNDEIKRKVIGQVLQYGAGLWEMSYEELDQKVQLRTNRNLADLVREAVTNVDWDEEGFRATVEASLQAGNFILMIVVDEIREELSRIVRFINDAGKPSFSFAALEMRRFQHNQTEMLVPHVFGASVRPAPIKINKFKWDEASFIAELSRLHPETVESTRRILDWAKDNEKITRIYWGEGAVTGSFVPIMRHNEQNNQLFAVYTYGSLEVYFQWYQHKPPFDSVAKRKELLARLNMVEGVQIPEVAITKRPNIRLSDLLNLQALEELLGVFDWMVDEILAT